MILKLYIQKTLFHLPRNQEDLTEMVKENFYKRKELIKSSVTKLYFISDIENKNVKYEKNTNIFLINLYLLILEYNREFSIDSEISITLSDENILKELSKNLGEDLKDLSIEELEEKIDSYISTNKNSVKQNKKSIKGSDKQTKGQNVDVEFSLAWVKEMDKKIKE